MLKCKSVAHLASDYLDHHTTASITWQIRWHLMLCANCRRFMRHLKITNKVAVGLVNIQDEFDPEDVLKKIKLKMNNESNA